MNLGEYIKKKEANTDKNKQNPTNKNTNAQDIYNKYSSYDEQQLMQELFKNAEQSRNNGELNNNMLDQFYAQAQSMLTKEQAERMQELILQLKK
ncbi:MAG: hypothetical protein R3Y23_05910 [Bacillota bacterium]